MVTACFWDPSAFGSLPARRSYWSQSSHACAASEEAKESVESLEKDLEGLKEDMNDLKKVCNPCYQKPKNAMSDCRLWTGGAVETGNHQQNSSVQCMRTSICWSS